MLRNEPVQSIEAIELTPSFLLHNTASEQLECIDELGLCFVRFDAQIPPPRCRPDHCTRNSGLMNEEQSIAVGLRKRLENTAGLFANTEVVPKKRQYERGCIAASRVLNALSCRIYRIGIHIDIECQKRIYSKINAKFALDPS